MAAILVTGARRLHRLQLRALLARAPSRRPRRRARPAHLRRGPREPRRTSTGVTFVHADIGDPDVVEAVLDEHRHRRRRELRRRVAQQPGDPRPGAVLPHQRARHAGLCEAAKRVGVARFHHVSTCEVYGDLDLDTDEVFTEDSPYRPRTPYNASKAGGDHAVRAYHETFGLPITITNCANNYGPYQFPEKVIPLFTTHALDDQPLPMYASTREPARVDPRPRPLPGHRAHPRRGVGSGETYHVGTGVEQSIEQIADAVLAHLGKPDAEDDRARPPRPRPPLRPRLVEDPRRAGLGADGRVRRRVWPRRSTGTPTIGPGGSRCETGRRSSRATAWKS